MSLDAIVALNRFGMGARPGDLSEVARDPRKWLRAQIESRAALAPAMAALKSSDEIAHDIPEGLSGQDLRRSLILRGRAIYQQEVALRYAVGIGADQGLTERLARFWSNHFTVSTTNPRVAAYAGAMEREAIRPYMTGKFEDMLLAVVRHPAMLIYLDNIQSFGPNSPAGQRRDRGLNENLAREILELHTLGVNGGYTQDDVIGLAKIITGWQVYAPNLPKDLPSKGAFVFLAYAHEPGDHKLLGKTYPASRDDGQGRAALRDIARHPSTAQFVATKLARHFIADDPPQAAVDELAAIFRETGGDLQKVTLALVERKEAWEVAPRKFRSPEDFVIAGMRALSGSSTLSALAFVDAAKAMDDRLDAMSEGMSVEDYQRQLRDVNRGNDPAGALLRTVQTLGQYPYTAKSPAGWPDVATFWASPDALLERLEWASAITARIGVRMSPTELAGAVLGDRLSDETQTVLAGAASPAQGAALVLSSPEFQRR
ncbi:MAG: DUF1800 domain-containing protein [Alphaproteobacteria bacterium]|nr:DUF1800 domain-containing protein [Alphaproteobacteria bacterium]